MKKIIVDLYADGGVIQKNPSMIGGTYAYVLIRDGKAIWQGSGVYDPQAMGTPVVTNNQMELLAILLGLQYCEAAHYVVRSVTSDSQITLGRVFQGWSLKGIPDWMKELKRSLSIQGIEGRYVKGHNGDKYNEMCDQLCYAEGQAILSKHLSNA